MITVITWLHGDGILFLSVALDKNDIHNERKKN